MQNEHIPTVSVVIGVYNGQDTISSCLESMLKQNYPFEKYEIIVVENGSVDKTTEIVEQFPVRLYHNSVRGLAPARNYGIARSQSEIIATTDADCIAHPDWLRELVKPYNDARVGAVCGNILAFDAGERSLVEQFSDEFAPLVNFVSGPNEFLPHLAGANASFRRNLVNAIGGFDERLMTGEDVDISWRLQLETGTSVVYAPDAIIYHKHRTTVDGLARLYRHYGFGEIQLDTMYRKYPGYPRDLKFQIRRILQQISALPKYAISIFVRRVRMMLGRATPYEAMSPYLWLMIEWNNIVGKWKALQATRFMKTIDPIMHMDRSQLIEFLYGKSHG